MLVWACIQEQKAYNQATLKTRGGEATLKRIYAVMMNCDWNKGEFRRSLHNTKIKSHVAVGSTFEVGNALQTASLFPYIQIFRYV
jgi:hypothetical protein